MIGKVIDWLGRRQAALHRIEETTLRAETRLNRVETVVAEQRRESAGCPPGAAVNIIYDRLTGPGKGEHRHG